MIPENVHTIVSEWPRKGVHFPVDAVSHHVFADSKQSVKRSFQTLQDKGIESFYNSDVCFFCNKVCEGRFIICEECKK